MKLLGRKIKMEDGPQVGRVVSYRGGAYIVFLTMDGEDRYKLERNGKQIIGRYMPPQKLKRTKEGKE